jgi:FKBP-type peptidyl-prolyl cis-trans isomerase
LEEGIASMRMGGTRLITVPYTQGFGERVGLHSLPGVRLVAWTILGVINWM